MSSHVSRLLEHWGELLGFPWKQTHQPHEYQGWVMLCCCDRAKKTWLNRTIITCLSFVCHGLGSHCRIETQGSKVTALCWAQTFSLWTLEQQAGGKNRPVENLLVGRLDGSLCWLQVTMQEIDLQVKTTELTRCYRNEGEEDHSFYKFCLSVCCCLGVRVHEGWWCHCPGVLD